MARRHRSLEFPATAICRETVSEAVEETPRENDMVYGWCGPARYASSVGFKTSILLGSGTVQNSCLVSFGQTICGRIVVQKLFLRFLLLFNR